MDAISKEGEIQSDHLNNLRQHNLWCDFSFLCQLSDSSQKLLLVSKFKFHSRTSIYALISSSTLNILAYVINWRRFFPFRWI